MANLEAARKEVMMIVNEIQFGFAERNAETVDRYNRAIKTLFDETQHMIRTTDTTNYDYQSCQTFAVMVSEIRSFLDNVHANVTPTTTSASVTSSIQTTNSLKLGK